MGDHTAGERSCIFYAEWRDHGAVNDMCSLDKANIWKTCNGKCVSYYSKDDARETVRDHLRLEGKYDPNDHKR